MWRSVAAAWDGQLHCHSPGCVEQACRAATPALLPRLLTLLQNIKRLPCQPPARGKPYSAIMPLNSGLARYSSSLP